MRVSESCLRNFASKACSNLMGLDYREVRYGHILAKTESRARIQGKSVDKEVIFFIGNSGINVRTDPLSTNDRTPSNEVKVFDAVPEETLEEPEEPIVDFVEREMIEHAYNMTLHVLGLNDFQLT